MKRGIIIIVVVALLVLLCGWLFLATHQRPVEYTELRPEVEPLEPEMVEIPGGTFLMGNPEGTEYEKPVHEVTVSAFSIGRYEVTNEEYRRFADATDRPYPADPSFAEGENYFLTRPRHPVVEITWTDAAAYCLWLSDRTGKNYHLPTEAQWERAARGGLEGKIYPWGDERLEGMARMNLAEVEGTVEVGQFPPNGYGLYDIAGNVNEMVQDWYDEDWYADSPRDNPTGPSGWSNYFTLIAPPERSRLKGRCKVVRGGSYRAPFDWVTRNPDNMLEIPVMVGARDYLYQEPYTHFDLGFRVALD